MGADISFLRCVNYYQIELVSYWCSGHTIPRSPTLNLTLRHYVTLSHTIPHSLTLRYTFLHYATLSYTIPHSPTLITRILAIALIAHIHFLIDLVISGTKGRAGEISTILISVIGNCRRNFKTQFIVRTICFQKRTQKKIELLCCYGNLHMFLFDIL